MSYTQHKITWYLYRSGISENCFCIFEHYFHRDYSHIQIISYSNKGEESKKEEVSNLPLISNLSFGESLNLSGLQGDYL